MLKNQWITNYLSHVTQCGQGLGGEPLVKFCNPALLQKGALSFPKNVSLEDKNALARSVTDIDAELLAVLPKVSELRKHFEATVKSEPKMNRKERIARRLEGIETDVPSALVSSMQHTPGLVTNRLLEEDTPRYTRASDSSEPGIVVRRYSRDELEAPGRQSRPRTRPDHQPPVHSDPAPNPGGPDPASLSSKAERIARYKAERRKQLSERYGILLDQEADMDYTPRYTRARRESDLSDKPAPPDRGRGEKPEVWREEEAPDKGTGRLKYSSSGMGRVSMSTDSSAVSVPSPKERVSTHTSQEKEQRSLGTERERERAMNLENNRRTPDRSPKTRSQDVSVAMEMAPAQPAARGVGVAAVSSSPRTSRRASLPSTRSGISPGDLFIEQQAQNILSRQGIRVRERRTREDSLGRASDSGSDGSSVRRHTTVTPPYLAPHSEPTNQLHTRSAELPVQQQNLNAESPRHHRAQSAERPRIHSTHSTESTGNQRIASGEPLKNQQIPDVEPHGVHPSTMGHQIDYKQAQQLLSRYVDNKQSSQAHEPPQPLYGYKDFQQPLSGTGNVPQSEPRYRDTHQPMNVGSVAHQPAKQLPPKYEHTLHVSPLYGQTQQFVPGYTYGQPVPYGPREDLPPAYGQALHPGLAYHLSQLPAPLNGDTAHSSPGPPKTLELPDPRSNLALHRLVPRKEDVESRSRASAELIEPAHREGRATSRADPPSKGLLKSRKAVLPSEIRRRERSVDDTMQRGTEEALESRRSRRISQLEETKEKSGGRIKQLDEGVDRGKRRLSKEVREGHDERVRHLGDEVRSRGEKRISLLQEKAGEAAGRISQSGLPDGRNYMMGENFEPSPKKVDRLEEIQGKAGGKMSRLGEAQQCVDAQFDGKVGMLQDGLLWDGRQMRRAGQSAMQAENLVRESEVGKRMSQMEEKDGKIGQRISQFDGPDQKDKLDKVHNEGYKEVQRETSEGYGRRRRISQSENDEEQVRRRRISQSEDDWKGRRVHRISQSDKWDGRDQIGQSGGQEVEDPRNDQLQQNLAESMDTLPPQQQANESSNQRVAEVGGYLQKGSYLPQACHRESRDGGDLKPKIRIRSMSDIGVTQRSAALRSLERATSRESLPIGIGLQARDSGTTNGEVGTLDTRVSVAKLRHSYLENASGRRPELYANVLFAMMLTLMLTCLVLLVWRE